MILREWLALSSERLRRAGVESAPLEAQVLAAHTLGRDRGWILAHQGDQVDPLGLDRVLERRLAREPLAYILGWREFYGRKFRVDRSVLIPRQETEGLVDVGLALIEGVHRPSILDVGTGSGCIAITLKLERPDADVLAIDISPDALGVASANAESLGAPIELLVSDGFRALSGRSFDLIVSNPPYVARSDDLPPEVRDHEPHVALYSDGDGIAFYRRLATESAPHLVAGGKLAVEIGLGQSASVADAFSEEGWSLKMEQKDLAGIVRVLVFERHASDTG